MKSNVINQIKLDNGKTLVIEDLSRKIGADAYVVILKASMSIAVEQAPPPAHGISANLAVVIRSARSASSERRTSL